MYTGPIFDNIGKDIDVYPSVGLRHSGEAIRVNFGHEPFKYDIDYHVQQQRNSVWAKIFSTSVTSSVLDSCSQAPAATTASRNSASLSDQQTKDVINKLVLSYLEHHGYAKTIRTFQNQLTSAALPLPSAGAPTTSPASDHDTDMIDVPKTPETPTEGAMERRTKIIKSVIAGDIDSALTDTQAYHPAVLDAEAGLMFFKLRCRKFVELILEAAELKKRMRTRSRSARDESGVIEEMDGIYEDGMGMDVDEDGGPGPNPSSLYPAPARGGGRRRSSVSPVDGRGVAVSTAAQYETALNEAISYGQTLSQDYKEDKRQEVKQLFKQTFAIVAWEDPMTAGGGVAEVVGHEARVGLAHELNQAILSERSFFLYSFFPLLRHVLVESQGLPTKPVLETLYRHTAVCVGHLGLMGVGGAAFADMSKAFCEE